MKNSGSASATKTFLVLNGFNAATRRNAGDRTGTMYNALLLNPKIYKIWKTLTISVKAVKEKTSMMKASAVNCEKGIKTMRVETYDKKCLCMVGFFMEYLFIQKQSFPHRNDQLGWNHSRIHHLIQHSQSKVLLFPFSSVVSDNLCSLTRLYHVWGYC